VPFGFTGLGLLLIRSDARRKYDLPTLSALLALFPDATMSTTHNAFFYGTLLRPDIVRNVLKNDGSHLTAAPAILLVR